MCRNCDYPALLAACDLECTPNRLTVLEIIGASPHPLQAGEILKMIRLVRKVNRVTVYRILDLLVANSLLERMSTADRSYRYGLAPNENHQPHPHFYCTRCGSMECLNPAALGLNTEKITRELPGSFEKVEIRFDGICRNCLNR